MSSSSSHKLDEKLSDKVHLLIVRPGAIGDCLLSFPVLRALKEAYNNLHITFVSNAKVLPLALAFGLAETVSDYEQLQWAELFSTTGIHTSIMLEQLQRTDLAICWLRDTDGLLERNLRTAGVKQLIIAPGRPPEGMHIHIVEYLAQTVGVMTSGFSPDEVAPFHFIKEWNDSYGRDSSRPRISARGPMGRDESRPYEEFSSSAGLSLKSTKDHIAPVAIHPGSGAEQKCWPVHRFADVIRQLWDPNGLDGHSHSVLLLAGQADQKRIHDILDFIGDPPEPDMLKVMFDAPLLEVAQQLQQCSCYLGNDSGITHLAAMLGVPTVALFGPSDPAIWHPVGPAVRIIRAQMPDPFAGSKGRHVGVPLADTRVHRPLRLRSHEGDYNTDAVIDELASFLINRMKCLNSGGNVC
jgi:heptosyltransferase-3